MIRADSIVGVLDAFADYVTEVTSYLESRGEQQ